MPFIKLIFYQNIANRKKLGANHSVEERKIDSLWNPPPPPRKLCTTKCGIHKPSQIGLHLTDCESFQRIDTWFTEYILSLGTRSLTFYKVSFQIHSGANYNYHLYVMINMKTHCFLTFLQDFSCFDELSLSIAKYYLHYNQLISLSLFICLSNYTSVY